jgi:CRISPR-associated exonuclease Cas4
LRAITARVAAEARAMIASNHTPAPIPIPGCRRCSLLDACQPTRLQRPPEVARWLALQLASPPADEPL